MCDWERVKFDAHIPFKIDGFPNGELDLQQDVLIEGTLCDTDKGKKVLFLYKSPF